MKNQKGITLIALVITIIVLLILAGVAIAMLSGENGILKRATEARDNSAVSNAKEVIGLAINEGMTEYYAKTTSSTPENTTILAEVKAKLDNVTLDNVTKGSVAYDNGTTPTNLTITFTYDGTTHKGTITSTGALTWSTVE